MAKITVYADKYSGRITASGEIYDPTKLTAATNRKWQMGHWATVCFQRRCVMVKINDMFHSRKSRLPFDKLDLSPAAAAVLGIRDPMVLPVAIKGKWRK